MSKILRLDPHMANLIAAGEVVERPTSVVKELVENAIDASSTTITIHLMDAGTKSIEVIDNGYGMDPVDAQMAFERHATSKLVHFDDLYRIRSLGFRGEALPSIASVSEVELITSTDSFNGTKVVLKAGTLIEQSSISSPIGTKVTVKHLFYNTPARFKHIQSQSTELSYTIDYINKCALACPNIRFLLTNNGKTILQTSGSNDLLAVISETYGVYVAKHMVMIDATHSFFEIKGYASDNTITRSNRYGITVLVNGRVIKNRNLIYAITDAYQDLLVGTKYPIVVLHISVDPSLIDVNIHPSKFEIKITDEFVLKEWITKSIKQALSKQVLIPEVQMDASVPSIQTQEEVIKTAPSIDHSESILSLFENKEFHYGLDNIEENNLLPKKKDPFHNETFVQTNIDDVSDEKRPNDLPYLEYIGQFHGTYLLASGVQELYLIDQHAAMERVMYEKISHQLQQQSISIYELLIPFQLHYSLSEYQRVLDLQPELQALGVNIEDFGSGTVVIRSIPSWILPNLIEEFVRDMIEQLMSTKEASKAILLDNIAKSLSCKSSIKANMFITKEEVKTLLEELNTAKNPYTCPHGRPVMVKLSTYEIEKWFKRVV